MFCSSVFFCEKKNIGNVWGEVVLSRWWVFSLTERTEFTESFGAHFKPTERLRHTENTEAFQLRLAVTFCDIGWLNVSVAFVCSVHLCSSVRNRMHPLDKIRLMQVAGEFFLSTWGGFFSHRAHRVHWVFWRTFRAHRTPSAYREHRGLSTKISCNVLWYRLT